MTILIASGQPRTAAPTFASLIGYAVVYTKRTWKRATPQNIVIGGIAGAAPPVLGWAAVSPASVQFACAAALSDHFRMDAAALLGARDLPPRRLHARKCRCCRSRTVSCADARWHVLYYTILLVLVTALPYLTGMSGLFYFGGALVLGF